MSKCPQCLLVLVVIDHWVVQAFGMVELTFWLLDGVAKLWLGLVLGMSGVCRCDAATPGLSEFQ